ncbi:MAG TPA: hypothetical protein VHS99_14930 [Chloroflexota bacterium]|nr:hypothetical protein [Chloroflexota bacterium]
MANKWLSTAVGLLGAPIAGRVLSTLLSSQAGERLLRRLDGRPLTPLEHRVLAQRWSGNIAKAATAAAVALLLTQRDSRSEPYVTRTSPMGERNINWVQVMQRTGEILLALGAIFRVVGEYLEDREKTAAESERQAARRLT